MMVRAEVAWFSSRLGRCCSCLVCTGARKGWDQHPHSPHPIMFCWSSHQNACAARRATELKQWSFDGSLSTHPAEHISNMLIMFRYLDVQNVLSVSLADCEAFCISMRDGYANDNGLQFTRFYHNFNHAMDVAQTMFSLFGFTEERELLSPVEKIVLLIAAVGHDIGHPGVNNQYLLETNHPLTQQYGNTSVLEKMHAAKTLKLINRHNLFQHLQAKMKRRMQRLVISTILSTDSARHDAILQTMSQLVDTKAQLMVGTFNDHERSDVACFLLHCADISNPAKPFYIAERWTHLIMREFFEQGKAEKQANILISPNCDELAALVPELQIQFINSVILPSFTVLEKLLPKSSEALDNIQTNVSRWQEKATERKTCNGDNPCNIEQTNATEVHSPNVGHTREINDSPKVKQHNLPSTIPASSFIVATYVRQCGGMSSVECFSDFTAPLAISLRLRRSQSLQVFMVMMISFCFAFVERLYNGETLLMFESIGTLIIQLVATHAP